MVKAWLEAAGLGVVFNCWMLLNPEEPKERPEDEFLAQAPETPKIRVKTKNNGRSFFIGRLLARYRDERSGSSISFQTVRADFPHTA